MTMSPGLRPGITGIRTRYFRVIYRTNIFEVLVFTSVDLQAVTI
jgi:hypothetical protein